MAVTAPGQASPSSRRHHRRAQAALRRAGEHRARRARAARQGYFLSTRRICPTPSCSPNRPRKCRQIVQLCARHKTPIIAFGTGTSLEGHVSAPNGGISLDVSRMNKVLAGQRGRPRRRGAARRHAQAAQRIHARHRAVLPDRSRRRRLARRHGEHARLGHQRGALRHDARERAGAARSSLPTAASCALGGRARKSAAGYDLTRSCSSAPRARSASSPRSRCGSTASPKRWSAATCAFDDLEGAVNTVIQTIQSGIPVARIELLDALHGRHGEQVLQAQPAAEEHCCCSSSTAPRPAPRSRPRWCRRSPPSTAAATSPGPARPRSAASCGRRATTRPGRPRPLRPGWGMWATDVCVPISRLAECILETQKDIVANGLYAPIVGHVGDGNFHLTMMVNPDDPTDLPQRRGAQRPHGRARAGDGRHLHRRARRRHGQDQVPRTRSTARRCR